MKIKILDNQKSFFIFPTLPFHFDGTFHKPSYYPTKLEEWGKDCYWFGLRLGEKIFGIRIENKEEKEKPKIKITVFYEKKISKEEMEKIKNEIIWRFNLDADLKEFVKLSKKDKRFFPIFKRWMGMRVSTPHSLYELLMIGIFLQNATVKRTVQMTENMLKKYGTKLKFDNKEIFVFWLPKDIGGVSEEELRSLKIGYRAKFIKRLSQDFINNKIDEFRLRKFNKETVKKELMKLYGVGPETARILLFEAFHFFDVFDHIAPWQQKIYSRLFYNKSLVPVEKIRDDIKKQYGKYSMLAVHYIWEDIFWRRKNEKIEWLEKEIRL